MKKRQHPHYSIWYQMRRRCLVPHSQEYKRYGARGIAICKEWDDFWVFAKDIGPKPSPDHSLDRKDNNKNYCKENCCWATKEQQARNRRTTVLTLEKATDICHRVLAGQSKRSIQRQYGLGSGHVRDIVKGKIWKEASSLAINTTNPHTDRK